MNENREQEFWIDEEERVRLHRNMERSSKRLGGLGIILILYGAGNALIELIVRLGERLLRDTEYEIPAEFSRIAGLVLLVAMALIFYFSRKKLLEHALVYGASLYEFWGVFLFLLPITLFVVPYATHLVRNPNHPYNVHILPCYLDMIELVILLFGILMTGFLLKSLLWKLLGGAAVAMYFVSYVLKYVNDPTQSDRWYLEISWEEVPRMMSAINDAWMFVGFALVAALGGWMLWQSRTKKGKRGDADDETN